MGYPYFNPPGIQKVNSIERGDYFVPTGGVEPESVSEVTPTRARAAKIFRISCAVIAVTAFVLMGLFVILD